MKNSGNLEGNLAGCPFTPVTLHNLRYFELLSELGICNRLEGIAPPLSLLNPAEILCPDGLSLGS